jgi:hypothetical protein
MKKQTLFAISFLFIMLSCENKKKYDYENRILGDWVFEKENPKIKNRFYSDCGYSFEKNGICYDKPGYYETLEKNNERQTIFYGTKTKYKVIDDSLFMYSLVSKKWFSVKIDSINTKFLRLRFEKDVVLEFSKQNYSANEKDDFDKIIISKSPCFGSCAINDLEIHKNGTVLYNGHDYNLKNGFYTSKIQPEGFEKIETDFKKAHFLELKNDYAIETTDLQKVSITFIKDDKIIKTITDYGRQSPKSFRITYEPIAYLYQHLRLKKIENIKDYRKNLYYEFERENKSIQLSSSEGFYLSNLLGNAKPSYKSFHPEYIIKYDNDLNVTKIETDGQYFKVHFKDESPIVLDLGFNFIVRNNLKERLKLKKE